MPPKGGGTDLTPDAVLAEVATKMDRTLDAFKRDLTQLRTGRATPALVENLVVDYYGAMTPLKQIASISAPDARAIMIQPWDIGSLREIEKSLMTSDMGFNPSNDGAIITDDTGVKPGNGLVGTRFADLHLAGDGVSRANRRLEAPVHLEEHGAGSWQVIGALPGRAVLGPAFRPPGRRRRCNEIGSYVGN